jgi:sodium/bile acid cotransporter 7
VLQALRRWAPDPFIIALLASVGLASVLPCRGQAATAFGWLTNAAIALLFFMHGVRLSRDAVLGGLGHWRLHLAILAATFLVFPALGLLMSRLAPGLLPQPLWLGVLFVCALPSTIQSSIAFTSIARGNVPAAIGAATLSNVLGVLLTPVLVSLLMSLHGAGASLSQVWKVVAQLLAPFVAGQLLRPWLFAWADRHKRLTTLSDRGSILLAVYTSFSAAVVQGLWRQLPLASLAVLVILLAVLLAIVLAATTWGARTLGFSREDEIAIVFCGSKKSLATGVPMANVLFAGGAVGMTVLPLMIFHQMQLMACAALARRYAARAARGS